MITRASSSVSAREKEMWKLNDDDENYRWNVETELTKEIKEHEETIQRHWNEAVKSLNQEGVNETKDVHPILKTILEKAVDCINEITVGCSWGLYASDVKHATENRMDFGIGNSKTTCTKAKIIVEAKKPNVELESAILQRIRYAVRCDPEIRPQVDLKIKTYLKDQTMDVEVQEEEMKWSYRYAVASDAQYCRFAWFSLRSFKDSKNPFQIRETGSIPLLCNLIMDGQVVSTEHAPDAFRYMIALALLIHEKPPLMKAAAESQYIFFPDGGSALKLRVLYPLYAGSVSNVILCESEALGHQVCVKIIAEKHGQENRDDEIFMRLENESRILLKLNHERCAGIPRLIAQQRQNGYMVRLATAPVGSTVSQISYLRWVESNEVLHLVDDIAEVLHGIHQVNVLHRDVKPENIIVVGKRFELIDFDLALDISDRHVMRTSNQVGTYLFTPAEVILDQEITLHGDFESLLYTAVYLLPTAAGDMLRSAMYDMEQWLMFGCDAETKLLYLHQRLHAVLIALANEEIRRCKWTEQCLNNVYDRLSRTRQKFGTLITDVIPFKQDCHVCAQEWKGEIIFKKEEHCSTKP